MPGMGGDGIPLQRLNEKGEWTTDGVITTGFRVSVNGGPEVEVIKDGVVQQSEAVRVEGNHIFVTVRREAPAAATEGRKPGFVEGLKRILGVGGKERRG